MGRPNRRRRSVSVALAGIDGAGKTTAARQLAKRLEDGGRSVGLYRNPGGRKFIDNWARRNGRTAKQVLGTKGLDRVETLIRIALVLRSLALSRARGGLALFDRSLHCQAALQRMRGVEQSPWLDRLIRAIPQPDVVVYFEIPPELADARIRARGTDIESIEDLRGIDAAYRSLPDFADFRLIDADGSPERVAARLQQTIDDAFRTLPQPS